VVGIATEGLGERYFGAATRVIPEHRVCALLYQENRKASTATDGVRGDQRDAASSELADGQSVYIERTSPSAKC